MKKIKYVQLEAAAFFTDTDYMQMDATQRGCYVHLMLLLYANNGKIEFNKDTLAAICNCQNFEQIWGKIKKKFVSRNGNITHKRVRKELRRAKKHLQIAMDSGLRGAKKRWGAHSDPIRVPNGDPIAKERKEKESEVNVSEEKVRERLRIRNTSSSFNSPSPSPISASLPELPQQPEQPQQQQSQRPSPTITSRVMLFQDKLCKTIYAHNQSDRTTFRNIGNWLAVKVQAGHFEDHVFDKVLKYAAEAAGGKSRNPAAVFISILKKELGYRKGTSNGSETDSVNTE